jgi:hypothetical protein
MGIKALYARWTSRRLDLAMKQIGNPVDHLDQDLDSATKPVRAGRGMQGALNRTGKAKSKTEWRGD